MTSVTMKQTDFILRQAVQLKGTKFWGKVRMIETDPETGEQTRIYVQLLSSKRDHPEASGFETERFDHQLVPCLFDKIEDRAASNNDIFSLISRGDLAKIKTLKLKNLDRQPMGRAIGHHGAIGWALAVGTIEVIQYLLEYSPKLRHSAGWLNYLYNRQAATTQAEYLLIYDLLLKHYPNQLVNSQVVRNMQYQEEKYFAILPMYLKQEDVAARNVKGYDNLLVHALRSGAYKIAQHLIVNGFDLYQTIDFLKHESFRTHGNPDRTQLDGVRETLKSRGHASTAIEDLIKFAKDPERWEANEVIKQEIGL